MPRALPALLALLLAAAPAAADEVLHHLVPEPARAAPPGDVTLADSAFAVRLTANNLIEMTTSNYGFFGNNFASSRSSFVYPKGATPILEHMVRAGIWVGAKAQDANGQFYGVITGAVDGAQGGAATGQTEWTPYGKDIEVRSILPSSKYYNLDAVSQEDLLCTFDDRVVRQAAFNSEPHRPMGILVSQESYAWSFADYAHCLFVRLKIKNTGAIKESLWVGMYAELASGNKSAYLDRGIWPPSSTGSTIGGWYTKKWIEYDPDIRLFREHYCLTQPIPDGCNYSFVPAWTGFALLGSQGLADDTTSRRLTMAAWNYNPLGNARRTDVQRYEVMSTGLITTIAGQDSLLPGTGDPAELVAVGPFPILYTDSTITVDFVFVGGTEVEDIRTHTQTAQRAYDRGYIIPIPPPSPRMKTVARDGAIDLYWDDLAEQASDPTSIPPEDWEGYRVYFGEDPLDLKLTAQVDNPSAPGDTTGFNTGLDAVLMSPSEQAEHPGYKYRYTFRPARNGFRYYASVTAYDLGSREISSLESGVQENLTQVYPGPAPGERAAGGITVYPNPYRVEAAWDAGRSVRDHYLWFANLPPRCTIRIYTLAGDKVIDRAFDGSTYTGGGARGVYDPEQPDTAQPPIQSGTSFAWDLISDQGQAVATGLYLYSVESPDGERKVGKILIVKSDRE